MTREVRSPKTNGGTCSIITPLMNGCRLTVNTFTVTVNGVTISFKSEEHVTQCKVGSCHDGGNRDECYRSHWVAVCV